MGARVLPVFAGALFLLHPGADRIGGLCRQPFGDDERVLLPERVRGVRMPKTEALTMAADRCVLLLFGIACASEGAYGCSARAAVVDRLLLHHAVSVHGHSQQSEVVRADCDRRRDSACVASSDGAAASADSAGFQMKEFTWYEYLFTQFRVIWLYLRLYVAPYRPEWRLRVPDLAFAFWIGGSVFGLLGLLALAVVAWRYRREYPLASFGYFGFLLLLAPTSSVVPIRDVAVERRLYLPFICLLLITVEFLRRWKTSGRRDDRARSAVFARLRLWLSYQRNQVWSNALAFWEDTARSRRRMLARDFSWRMRSGRTGSVQQAVANYERVSKMQASRMTGC